MRLSLFISMLCIAGSAAAQVPDTVSRPLIGAWASLTLGPGKASNRDGTRIGAQLGGYGSYGHWLAGYRRGGASGIESGGVYDDAVLFGRRVTEMYTTGFVAVGPAKLYDESTGQGTLGLGFNAEAGVNVRAIGLGASLFGAVASHRSYIAIGLTADAGWLR